MCVCGQKPGKGCLVGASLLLPPAWGLRRQGLKSDQPDLAWFHFASTESTALS